MKNKMRYLRLLLLPGLGFGMDLYKSQVLLKFFSMWKVRGLRERSPWGVCVSAMQGVTIFATAHSSINARQLMICYSQELFKLVSKTIRLFIGNFLKNVIQSCFMNRILRYISHAIYFLKCCTIWTVSSASLHTSCDGRLKTL